MSAWPGATSFSVTAVASPRTARCSYPVAAGVAHTQFWGRHSITIAWSSQRRVLPGRRSSRRSEGGEKSQEVPHPLVVGLAAQVAHILFQVDHLQLLRAAHSTHTSRGRHYTSSLTTLTLEAVEKMVLWSRPSQPAGSAQGLSPA